MIALKCQGLVEEYEELAYGTSTDPTEPRVALIEMPPFSDRSTSPSASNAGCIHGRLSNDNNWFMEVPAKLGIVDSFVYEVGERL